MKTIFALVSIFLTQNLSTKGQNLDWIKQIGSSLSESHQCIAADNQGNIFIAGSTASDSLDILGTSLAIQATSTNTIFIVKCDSSANVIWASFYSTSGSTISDICVDQQGNCFVVGSLIDTLFISNDTLSDPTSDPTGFILSINPIGSLNWYRHLSSTCELNPRKIIADNSGNIYTCGRFFCNGIFDTLSVNTVGNENFYIAKFSDNGNVQWVKSGTGKKMLTLNYSSTGIISACTQYYDTLTIDNVSIFANNPYETIAIVSYDSTGYLTQMRNIGHADNNSASSNITGLTTDILSNIYISGSFDSTNVFADTTISSYQDNDVFILKLNSDGSTFSFKRLGGIHNDLCYSLITDDNGISYLCGSFPGAMSFDGTWYFTAGTIGIYICRLDSSLNVEWVMHSDNNFVSEATDLSLTNDGKLYATGSLNGPLDWAQWSLNSFGFEDIWVARISDITMSSESNLIEIKEGMKIYPNPSTGYISFNDLPELKGRLEVYNLQGNLLAVFNKDRLMKTAEMNLHFQSGMYLIRYISDDKTKMRYGKLVLN